MFAQEYSYIFCMHNFPSNLKTYTSKLMTVVTFAVRLSFLMVMLIIRIVEYEQAR